MDKPKDLYFIGCSLTTCMSYGGIRYVHFGWQVVFIIIIIMYIKSAFLVSFDKYN